MASARVKCWRGEAFVDVEARSRATKKVDSVDAGSLCVDGAALEVAWVARRRRGGQAMGGAAGVLQREKERGRWVRAGESESRGRGAQRRKRGEERGRGDKLRRGDREVR